MLRNKFISAALCAALAFSLAGCMDRGGRLPGGERHGRGRQPGGLGGGIRPGPGREPGAKPQPPGPLRPWETKPAARPPMPAGRAAFFCPLAPLGRFCLCF